MCFIKPCSWLINKQMQIRNVNSWQRILALISASLTLSYSRLCIWVINKLTSFLANFTLHVYVDSLLTVGRTVDEMLLVELMNCGAI